MSSRQAVLTRPTVTVVSEGKRSLFMSKEKGEELFGAFNVILNAVSSLNLRDLEAEAKADRGESSSKAAAESSKGKDKVAEPDWEDIPFNPVAITPLSSRPRFHYIHL
jgi:hypothetical protein